MEERIIQFVRALRVKGVPVSQAETSDSLMAIKNLGIANRDSFRLSLRVTLIKRARDLPVFDELFPMFFSHSGAPAMSGLPEDLTEEEAQMIAEAMRNFNHRMRQMLEKLLHGDDLSPDELEQLRQMAGLNFVDDPRYQNWMQRRMEQALEFPQVKEAMEEMMAIMQEMGMNRDRLDQIRDSMRTNLKSMQEQLSRFIGQEIAENLSERADDDSDDSLYDTPFTSLTESEMEQLRSEVGRLAAVLRTRVALRQKRARTGQLDAKATIRANLRHAGIPFLLKFRDRKRKPKLVVICDISTSMRPMSELMLSLIYAMQDQITKTHAFAFIDHLEYISPDFTRLSAKDAVREVLIRMPPGYYSTDLGTSLEYFERAYMDTPDHRSTLIMVGDGRNNYNNPRLDLFSEMVRRAYKSIWLIPEAPYKWGTGDSDMLEYAPICDQVLQVSNLAELSAAVDNLLS